MYKKLIHILEMYANAIGILSKSYLLISLLPPTKSKEILDEVKKGIKITNTDYDIVIKRLNLLHDVKLVTFGINEERNLLVQFPIFVQPYIQQQFILYQIEMEQVPIKDLNKKHNHIHIYR